MRPAIGATFVLDVASVIDNEELVVKPGAPLVMSTGLYAGTSLPDNGRPMLLLDASGLATAVGVDLHERDNAHESATDAEASKTKNPSALLFIASDGEKRAIRLSVIDRMEDIDASQIKFVGGKMRAAVGGSLTDICELDHVPEDGMVKLLRLTDGRCSKYLAVEDVLDIFTIDGKIVPSARPELHEGVIDAFGEAVELLNVFQYFEAASGRGQTGGDRPLCFVESAADSNWEQKILAPLLGASGYNVTFDESDRNRAAIILDREDGAVDDGVIDARVLRLRENGHANLDAGPSIYRYDRVGLISAIEAKLAGGR